MTLEDSITTRARTLVQKGANNQIGRYRHPNRHSPHRPSHRYSEPQTLVWRQELRDTRHGQAQLIKDNRLIIEDY